MALVVMLLGILLWMLHRNETEEERHGLIKDILWVEQNLNFTLVSVEEKLSHLSGELSAGLTAQQFDFQARALLSNNPAMERVLVLGADGALDAAVPPLDGLPANDGERATAFTKARSMGKPAWTPAMAVPGRGTVVEVHAPLYRDRKFAGMVVGVFSLDGLLVHNVPWWVVEKYKVEIVDGNGGAVAARTSVDLAQPGLSHQVRFEPPGHGMGLVATVYRSGPTLVRNVLAASIFGLTVLALSSLWAVRRHVRHRLEAELALREEHAFRKAMEDSLTVGMRARDLDGRITYVNPAFCRMVGWSEDELVGMAPPMPYWLPEAMDSTMEMHRRVLRGDAPPNGFEIQFRRRDGEVFWALVYEAPLIDSSGRHTGWMASVLDVTERKQAEEMARLQQEKLQRTSRLITMGEMASTLAHELNQPLSAIASYNTGCLNKLASGAFAASELQQAMTKLGVQAQRAGQIIRRVHDFVRKAEPNLQPCSINEVVEDSLGFIEFDAQKRGVQLEVKLAAADPMVDADRILLEQVLLNLARNGIEAMGATPAGDRRLGVAVDCCAEQV
ncbi:MAG TPA: PAS domain S-box protein, partial [Candidatus Omnitrophota bacterium]|nr:PAS domain S-box protein [Candidatus Omnitrophota bacterium]